MLQQLKGEALNAQSLGKFKGRNNFMTEGRKKKKEEIAPRNIMAKDGLGKSVLSSCVQKCL